MVFSYYESGGVSVALQPHKPNLSCSMSGIPTNLMHNLTCLVEASNLSCSQVIWRQQLITAALHAQIKTWLWAIGRSGWAALPAARGTAAPRPALKPVPGAGCGAGPEVRQTPAGTHHGLQPFPTHTQLPCACQGQGLVRHSQPAGQWGCRAPKRSCLPRGVVLSVRQGLFSGEKKEPHGPRDCPGRTND